MKFLPYENLYLTTKLTPTEAASKLRDNIVPRSRNIFRFNTNTTRPYEGFIQGNQFEISRIIRYRNSFLPVIYGRFSNYGHGTQIHVTMRMHFFVYAFMTVWLGFVTFAGIAVIKYMVSENKFHPGIFVVLIMFLFGYGLTLGGFKYESIKSRKFLADLLQADVGK